MLLTWGIINFSLEYILFPFVAYRICRIVIVSCIGYKYWRKMYPRNARRSTWKRKNCINDKTLSFLWLFFTFFYILYKKYLNHKNFRIPVLTDLHVLKCLEHDFIIFIKCLSSCLRVTQIFWLHYRKNYWTEFYEIFI